MKKNVVSKNNNNLIHNHNINKKPGIKSSLPSNLASLNPIKINNSSNLSKKSKQISDDNFISLINQLSKIINLYYKSNNPSFLIMKDILANNTIPENDNKNNPKKKNDKEALLDKNLSLVSNSFNQIETSFNNFYSDAKIIFQKLKNYESNINNNGKQRNNIFKSVDNNNKYNEDYGPISSFGGDSNNYNNNFRMNKNLKTNQQNLDTSTDLIKINTQNKKSNKISNRSSSSIINNYNFSADKNETKATIKQIKQMKNNFKSNFFANGVLNNSSLITNQRNENSIFENENEYEKNLNLNIILEKNNKNSQNMISSKNTSCCNIRVNKPTRLIMENNLLLNDLSIEKSFHGNNNNNSISATNRNKKDLNKSFSSAKNNYLLSLKLSNNANNNKKNDISKLKNKPVKLKTLKENSKQIKDKLIQNQNNLETRNNNVSKNKTQGNFIGTGGYTYSTLEDENEQKKNSIKKNVAMTKNKSLKHLKTSKNLTLKRENSINNEENKIRVNSIEKLTFTELDNKIKNSQKNDKTNLKLNRDRITVATTARNKKISSPTHNNFEILKKQIFGDDYIENPGSQGKIDLLRTSVNELSIENQKLISELNRLKGNKDEEQNKKNNRLEGQILLLTRKNVEITQKLNESIESKKKLLNIIKGNEKKINEYNDMFLKNIELGKAIKNYERKSTNDNNKIMELNKSNKLLESKNKDLTKKLKNSYGKINELDILIKSAEANNELNNNIKNLESKVNDLNGINKKIENEKKDLADKVKDLEKKK
jgi:hypothetical protein